MESEELSSKASKQLFRLSWIDYLIVALVMAAVPICAFGFHLFDLPETSIANPTVLNMYAGIRGLAWGFKWIGGIACACCSFLYFMLTLGALTNDDKRL